jgi:hypothetical protein
MQLSELTRGVLVGMPLMLVLRPMQVAPEGKATTVYVVHLELRGADMQAIQNAARAQLAFQCENADAMRLLKTRYQQLMLPAPGGEDDGEAGDIHDEFQPKTQSDTTPTRNELAPFVPPAAYDTATLKARWLEGCKAVGSRLSEASQLTILESLAPGRRLTGFDEQTASYVLANLDNGKYNSSLSVPPPAPTSKFVAGLVDLDKSLHGTTAGQADGRTPADSAAPGAAGKTDPARPSVDPDTGEIFGDPSPEEIARIRKQESEQ